MIYIIYWYNSTRRILNGIFCGVDRVEIVSWYYSKGQHDTFVHPNTAQHQKTGCEVAKDKFMIRYLHSYFFEIFNLCTPLPTIL